MLQQALDEKHSLTQVLDEQAKMIEEAGLDNTEQEEARELVEKLRADKEYLKQLRDELTQREKEVGTDHNIKCALRIQLNKLKTQIRGARNMKKDPNFVEHSNEEIEELRQKIEELEAKRVNSKRDYVNQKLKYEKMYKELRAENKDLSMAAQEKEKEARFNENKIKRLKTNIKKIKSKKEKELEIEIEAELAAERKLSNSPPLTKE